MSTCGDFIATTKYIWKLTQCTYTYVNKTRTGLCVTFSKREQHSIALLKNKNMKYIPHEQ